MTVGKLSFDHKVDSLSRHLTSKKSEVDDILQRKGVKSAVQYMTKLATKFLQVAFQLEYKNELLGDEINNLLNDQGVNEAGNQVVENVNEVDGFETGNQGAENPHENNEMEVEEDTILPSNDEEAVNLNSDEGVSALQINFPMFNVQNISEEIDVSGLESRLQKLIHEDVGLLPSLNSSDEILSEYEPQPMDLENNIQICTLPELEEYANLQLHTLSEEVDAKLQKNG